MAKNLSELLSLLYGKPCSNSELSNAIIELAAYPAHVVGPPLIRMLGHSSDDVRSAAAVVLTKHGKSREVNAAKTAVWAWDQVGLTRELKALSTEDEERLFAICSKTSWFPFQRLYGFVSKANAKSAHEFIELLRGSNEAPWDEIAKELKKSGEDKLANVITERIESPPPGFSISFDPVPALVYAFICNVAPERRLLAVIGTAAKIKPNPVLRALHDEAEILKTYPENDRERRLLLLARSWPSPRLRASALYALGSANSDVVSAGGEYLKAHNEEWLARIMDGIVTKNVFIPHTELIRQGRDLLIPLKRRLQEAPNELTMLALWRLEGRDILPEIVALAAKEDNARTFLIRHAKGDAVPATLAAAREAYGDAKGQLISVLAEIADDSAMLQLLRSPSDHELVTAIANKKGGAWPFVIDITLALSSPEAQVRRDAAAVIRTLEARFAPAVVPGLLRLFSDPVDYVRETAFTALWSIKDLDLGTRLVERLGRPESQLDESRLLEAIAARVNADVLSECLESENPNRRRGAVAFLARRGISPKLLEPVRRLLSDSDPGIRIAAIDCLSNAGDRASLCPLLSLLRDPDVAVRRSAEQALRTHCPELARIWPSSRNNLVPLVEELYHSALHPAGGQSSDAGSPIAELVAIGREFASSPPDVSSLMTALEWAKDGTPSGDRRSAVLVATAIAIASATHLAREGEMADAIVVQKQVLALSRVLNEPRIEWRAWEAIGVLCEAIGDDAGAWQAFVRASEVVDRHWYSLVDSEISRDFFAPKAHLYDRAVLCAIRLGHDAAALEYSEKSRTRYLGDLIARRHAMRRRELAPQISEFWAAVDRVQSHPASADDNDRRVSSVRSVVAVFWTSEHTEGSPWVPKWLHRWQLQQSPGDDLRAISPYDAWRIVAWLAEEPEDRPDVRAALEELRELFVQVLASLRDPGIEQQTWETQYRRAASKLSKCKHPKDVHTWVFAEYSGWFKNLIRRMEWDPENVRLELNAFLEPLDVALRRGHVEAVMVDHDSSQRGGLVVRVADRIERSQIRHSPATSVAEAAALLQATDWRYVERLVRGEPVGFQRIRRAVEHDPGMAVIEFYVTRSGTIAFLVHARQHRAGTLEVFSFPDMGADALAQILFGHDGWLGQLAAWREHSITADDWTKGAEATLAHLYQTLFEPLMQRLRKLRLRRVLLIPHRGLEVVPFHALFRWEGKQRRFVIDDLEVTYAPSATLAHIAAERHQLAHEPDSVVAVHCVAPDLPFAGAEVDAVEQRFAPFARVISGLEVNLFTLRSETPLRSHFHFAGHAKYNAQSPLNSRLELQYGPSFEVGSLFDGALRLARVRVATLSACETGLDDPGDPASEYLGMAGGFLFSGARSVICTLWPVSDSATVLLMDRFYCELTDGARQKRGVVTPASALRTAQMWLRDLTAQGLRTYLAGKECGLGDPYKANLATELKKRFRTTARCFAHPLYWAPYIVSSGFMPAPTARMRSAIQSVKRGQT